MTAYFSKICLKQGTQGSTGALVSFLATSVNDIGKAHQMLWSLFPQVEEARAARKASATTQPTADAADVGAAANTAGSTATDKPKGGGKGAPTDSERPFVFRMSGPTLREPVYVYSTLPPVDGHGLWDIETKPFSPSFAVGDVVEIRVRMNPLTHTGEHVTAKGRTVAKGTKIDVPMALRTRGDKRPLDVIVRDQMPLWFAERAKTFGLSIDVSGYQAIAGGAAMQMGEDASSAAVDPKTLTFFADNYQTHRFAKREGGAPITIRTVDFHGTATVTDPDAFLKALVEGIGAGRSYGFGMMLVRKRKTTGAQAPDVASKAVAKKVVAKAA